MGNLAATGARVVPRVPGAVKQRTADSAAAPAPFPRPRASVSLVTMDSEGLRALDAVATAQSLKVPRSTLRRRIEQLETRAGATLVRVHRDGAALTNTGLQVLQRGRVLLKQMDGMLEGLGAGDDVADVGELRVGLPVGLPPEAAYPFITILRGPHPRLRVHLRLYERPAEAPLDELDAFLDFSDLPPPPGGVSEDLVVCDEVLLSGPACLGARGTPRSVRDLADHELLGWLPPDRDPGLWPRADGTLFSVRPGFVTADAHAVRYMAAQGAGIALVPEARAPGFTPEAFGLVQLLADDVPARRRLRLKAPGDVARSPAVRHMVGIVHALTLAP